jgi:hypothetical protein
MVASVRQRITREVLYWITRMEGRGVNKSNRLIQMYPRVQHPDHELCHRTGDVTQHRLIQKHPRVERYVRMCESTVRGARAVLQQQGTDPSDVVLETLTDLSHGSLCWCVTHHTKLNRIEILATV